MWWNNDKDKLLQAKEDVMGDVDLFAKKYGDNEACYYNAYVLDLGNKGV